MTDTHIHLLFLISSFSSCMMSGVIWIIQVVHYPSFHYIESSQFQNFSNMHRKNITFIVGPLMCIELLSSIVLFKITASYSMQLANLLTLAGIWFVTIRFSIPCHMQLSEQKNQAALKRLIRTNWTRTVLWNSRCILHVGLYFQANWELLKS